MLHLNDKHGSTWTWLESAQVKFIIYNNNKFLIDVILSRLNDNDAVVVNEAIHLLEELHLNDNQQINDILRKILQRKNQDW
jgi:hypothetical protein